MSAAKSNLKFSLWIIPAGILFGGILFGGTLAAAGLLRPEKGVTQAATPALTLIFAPTSTPVVPTSAIETASATPGGTGTTIGGIGVGTFVQIAGTEGNGLRLRIDPGTKADILFLGYESEVFKVTDGPVETDGYVWWHLTASYDQNRNGWAASNYLAVIEVKP